MQAICIHSQQPLHNTASFYLLQKGVAGPSIFLIFFISKCKGNLTKTRLSNIYVAPGVQTFQRGFLKITSKI